ncbi:conserved hypothetical protein [Histoplasma capsulatum H143]|uniref:Monooxygenase n=1 Tax=Ajellomyces capsulatus (strain H143) TaxID=544712 RepID=C6HBW4_AJECH|nr:conserved hypothetical protein [Histoplasma capsulatum H143]
MAEKSFHPLSSPQKTPSYMQLRKTLSQNRRTNIIRDNFTITTWLLVGGLIQGVVVALLGYLSLLPAVAVLAYRFGNNLLMALGWTKNRYLSNVLLTKFTAQMPRSDGSFGSTFAERPLVVFLIGAKSSHPLGAFDPVFLKLADYFSKMVRELRETAEESGYLGSSAWISTEDTTTNELMNVMYFRDFESLHKYAHGPLHIKGVKYWSSVVNDTPHVSIFHETYVVPQGRWENIYVNSRPTGLGAASFPVRSAQGKTETEWMSPIVDARTGALRGMEGRIQSDYLKGFEEKKSKHLLNFCGMGTYLRSGTEPSQTVALVSGSLKRSQSQWEYLIPSEGQYNFQDWGIAPHQSKLEVDSPQQNPIPYTVHSYKSILVWLLLPVPAVCSSPHSLPLVSKEPRAPFNWASEKDVELRNS